MLQLANDLWTWLNYGMVTPKSPFEEWSDRRKYTLDIAGLTESERKEGSIFLGGSSAEFVVLGDKFKYDQIGEIVFNWGDPLAVDIFNALLRHDDRPEDTDKEHREHELIPFGAATRFDDYLWSLTVQDTGFDLADRYEDATHYIEIPYDPVLGYLSLQNALERDRPTPEIIGKVGVVWVAFEMGTSLLPLVLGEDGEPIEKAPRHKSGGQPTDTARADAEHIIARVLGDREASAENLDPSVDEPETILDGHEIPIDEVLAEVERVITLWDFDNSSRVLNFMFATQISHWLLETFAQEDSDGEFHLYPLFNPGQDRDGFKGEKLPLPLHPLVMQEYMGEPHLSKENELKMESEHLFIKEPGSFPPSVAGMSHAETMQFFKDNPDEAAKIKPTRYTHIPQVVITLQPAGFNGWDLEFHVSPDAIKLLPIIDSRTGTTVNVLMDYIAHAPQHQAELAKTVTELALLAARSTNHDKKGTIPLAQLELLVARLSGEEKLPVIRGRRIPLPLAGEEDVL